MVAILVFVALGDLTTAVMLFLHWGETFLEGVLVVRAAAVCPCHGKEPQLMATISVMLVIIVGLTMILRPPPFEEVALPPEKDSLRVLRGEGRRAG